MISQNTKEAYSEIDEFLELLDEDTKEKVPEYLRIFFKDNKDKDYRKRIRPDVSIKEQNLKEETLALIAMLNLKYWCKDEEERQRLIKIYSDNEEKYNEFLDNEKISDVIFKNNKTANQESENLQNIEITKYKKETFIKKLLRKIKGMFK